MAREFFINPYTFVPLNNNGPFLRPRGNEYVHLFFDDECFTGVMEVKLVFVTPAVIPGEQQSGSSTGPGYIKAYRYGDRLAIPGSRIRGHLLNLMRTINSSPIRQFQDWDILRRADNVPSKGVIIKSNSGLKVRKIEKEILVKDPKRSSGPNLAKGCSPDDKPVAYSGSSPFDIPEYLKHFKEDGTVQSSPPSGDVYYQYQHKKGGGVNKYKIYLAKPPSEGSKPERESGEWVKFACWSGQDGENQLPDQTGKKEAHRNAWHVVKTDWITKKDYDLPQDIIEKYENGVRRAARVLEERGESQALVERMKNKELVRLEPGMFVYFLPDASGKRVGTIGRHYRYLVYLGSVDGLIRDSNRDLKGGAGDMVRDLSGYAKERAEEGLKGRLWVEMAFGPQCADPGLLEEKDLRILSSQPPKSRNFYLKGGDYGSPKARAMGRKFYWHDPLWKEKKWDNQDLQGNMGFENPVPDNPKLWEQWHRSEILMASEDKPVAFSFRIRFMNLSRDEFYLLITAMVGFSPTLSQGSLSQENWKEWCHKIGHARPFLGSAYLKLKEVSLLDFDKSTLEPTLKHQELEELKQKIRQWQDQSLQGDHLGCLKRVMRFDGAREDLCSTTDFVPITYPLGQRQKDASPTSHITWLDGTGCPFYKKGQDKKEPKIYTFFSTTRHLLPDLPYPVPGVDQSLPVYFDASSTPGGRGAGKASHGKGKGLGCSGGPGGVVRRRKRGKPKRRRGRS